MYNDIQLKQALAKMLPEELDWSVENDAYEKTATLCWQQRNPVLDTELLHLCWLVEETLRLDEQADLYMTLYGDDYGHGDQRDCLISLGHATWQQRVIALCKVKGIKL